MVFCGRYEGIDERVRAHVATEEISIGDYVLSGGELPALVLLDAVARLVPGVVGDEDSVGAGFLRARACSTTRTTRGRRSSAGWRVPDVLLSGHHARDRDVAAPRGAAGDAGTAPGLDRPGRLDAEHAAWLDELTQNASTEKERELIMNAIETVERPARQDARRSSRATPCACT